MSSTKDGNAEYVLGHSEHELDRLERQGQFFSGLTRGLLLRAGIKPGMRVLDFAAGAGDVSMLVSELVGPGGEVVAIERSPEAIEHARMRLAQRNISNVRLVLGDENTLPQAMDGKPFDAVVGRLVLVHQRDLSAVFVHLTKFLKPGGIVAFHEVDVRATNWTSTHLPLFDRMWSLLIETTKKSGLVYDMSAEMMKAFDAAGITDRHLIREGRMESGKDAFGYEFISRTVRSFMPAMLKLGLATESDIGIDTLADRFRDEAVQAQASIIPVYLLAAYGRTRGA